jgi:hypothetical protein
MNTTIPVWQTLSDAFSFVCDSLGLFMKALIIPVVILIAIQALGLLAIDPYSSVHWLVNFVSLLIFAWMMNICCRLVITGLPGKTAWTASETWSAVWLISLNFIIGLLAALPAFAVFTVMLMLAPLFALPLAAIVFLILDVYLFARFILVFPATAMGDKASFREAWEMSEGNGWRLVILFALIPFLYSLVAFFLGILLPVQIFFAFLLIIGVFFSLLGIVAVAMAYKKLRI